MASSPLWSPLVEPSRGTSCLWNVVVFTIELFSSHQEFEYFQLSDRFLNICDDIACWVFGLSTSYLNRLLIYNSRGCRGLAHMTDDDQASRRI